MHSLQTETGEMLPILCHQGKAVLKCRSCYQDVCKAECAPEASLPGFQLAGVSAGLRCNWQYFEFS